MSKPTMDMMYEYYSKTTFIETAVNDLRSQGLIESGSEYRNVQRVIKANNKSIYALNWSLKNNDPLGGLTWWTTKKTIDKNVETMEHMIARKKIANS